MFLIFGVALASIAVVVIYMRVPGGVDGAPLGQMSQQWLAEHRAIHSA